MFGATFSVQGLPLRETLPALAAWVIGKQVAPTVVATVRRLRAHRVDRDAVDGPAPRGRRSADRCPPRQIGRSPADGPAHRVPA